jgi:hypothetical protein
MPEESTTPDRVAVLRRGAEALSRDDFGELMSQFAPHAVWDLNAWRPLLPPNGSPRRGARRCRRRGVELVMRSQTDRDVDVARLFRDDAAFAALAGPSVWTVREEMTARAQFHRDRTSALESLGLAG